MPALRLSPLVRLFAFAVVCFGLVVPAAAQDKAYRPDVDAKEIDDTLGTEWYGMYLEGKKIGYFRTTRARAGDQVSESFTMHMKLLSFGQKSELTMTQDLRFENKKPYRLVSGIFEQKTEQKGLSIAQKLTLTARDKGFTLTQTVGKVEGKKDLGPIDYTLADAMASEVWVRRKPKVGDVIEYKEFDMQDLQVGVQKSKLLAIKKGLAGGVEGTYFEIDTETDKGLQIKSTHDDKGRALSMDMVSFEIRLEPEDQAKNTEYSTDLFVRGMVKVDKALGPTKQVKELVIHVESKEAGAFEDGPRQTVHPADGGKVLKLGKPHGKEAKATAKEIEEALAETTAYCISNAKVKELAAKAVGDAKTPEEKVKRIVDFTHDYIRPSLTSAVPHIHDLIERKKGDCKSYALLFTNLARAAGVPAREVAGLLYIGDDQKAFGGHAWNEVVLNGVWVPIDASLRQTEVDATHISFGTDQRAAKALLTTLGKLKFRVVESKGGN